MPQVTAPADAPVPVPEPGEKAIQFYRSGNALWIAGQFWGLLVPTVLLVTGWSARVRDAARWVARGWFLTIPAYYILFCLLMYVVDWPLDYYRGFVRLHAYGLSNQTFAKWLGDSLKSLGISIVVGCLFLWVPYVLLKKSPRRWWLYTSLLAVPFICLGMLVTPIWIAPLFNTFGEMKNKELEAKIVALADQAGIAGSRVFEVHKSVDTKALNAYVVGFLNTKRIVLWDTIIDKLDEQELLAVMGHEMGHYVLQHIAQGIALAALGVLASLFVVYRTAGWIMARYGHRLGFHELCDIASLPLLLLLAGLFGLVTAPIDLFISRHFEHEADRFALEITQDNRAAAMAFAKLQVENLSVPRPGPLYKLWRASHPPIGERIDFCNAYRPWATGQPLKYGGLFRTR